MTPCSRCHRPACDFTSRTCTRTDCALMRQPIRFEIASGSPLLPAGRVTAASDFPLAAGGGLLAVEAA